MRFECPSCDQHMEADDGYAGEEVACPGCGLIFNAPSDPGDGGSSASAATTKKRKKRKKKPRTKMWADYLPMPNVSRQFWYRYSFRRYSLCLIFILELAAFFSLFFSGGRLSTFASNMFWSLFGLMMVFAYTARGRMHSFERGRPSSLVPVVGTALVGLNIGIVVLLKNLTGVPGPIARGATTADAGHVIVAGTGGIFRPKPFCLGWNMKTDEVITIPPRLGRVTALGMTQTGPAPLAIAGTEDGAVQVWDTRDGVATASFALPDAVGGVALLDQGRVAVGAGGGEFVIWDTRSRDKIHKQSSRTMVVTGMTPSHDGKRVAVASRDTMGGGGPMPPGFMKDVNPAATSNVAPGGTIVALSIWDITGQYPMTVGSMNYRGLAVGRIRGMAFSPQGDRFFVGAEQGYVYLYDLKDRKLTQTTTGHYPDGIRAVAFSKTGKFLAAGTAKGRILVFEKNLETPSRTYSVGSRPVNVLSPTKNTGEFLYTVGKGIKRLRVK